MKKIRESGEEEKMLLCIAFIRRKKKKKDKCLISLEKMVIHL